MCEEAKKKADWRREFMIEFGILEAMKTDDAILIAYSWCVCRAFFFTLEQIFMIVLFVSFYRIH